MPAVPQGRVGARGSMGRDAHPRGVGARRAGRGAVCGLLQVSSKHGATSSGEAGRHPAAMACPLVARSTRRRGRVQPPPRLRRGRGRAGRDRRSPADRVRRRSWDLGAHDAGRAPGRADRAGLGVAARRALPGAGGLDRAGGSPRPARLPRGLGLPGRVRACAAPGPRGAALAARAARVPVAGRRSRGAGVVALAGGRRQSAGWPGDSSLAAITR